MSQPAFSDVQKPMTDGAAPAVAHFRREVFSVFGSSSGSALAPVTYSSMSSIANTLVSSAQLTQVSDIISSQVGVQVVVLGEPMKGRRTGPVQVLGKIATDWQLSYAELASLLAYPDGQSAAELLDGRASLRNPDREDRVRLLYRIYRVLSSLFPDVGRQQAWLRATNENLRNKSPLEFMMERRIPGMISVQNLVERLVAR
jgi:Protein of unknown function (DUF2384)